MEGRTILENGAKAALDISDGLVADCGHICQASGVGAVLEIARLPVRDEARTAFGSAAVEMALAGGEDYQLLFTAKPAIVDNVRKAITCPLTVIGEVVKEHPGEVVVLDENNQPYELRRWGWDHFSGVR
jgi:thiamine-monophosphate kinase